MMIEERCRGLPLRILPLLVVMVVVALLGYSSSCLPVAHAYLHPSSQSSALLRLGQQPHQHHQNLRNPTRRTARSLQPLWGFFDRFSGTVASSSSSSSVKKVGGGGSAAGDGSSGEATNSFEAAAPSDNPAGDRHSSSYSLGLSRGDAPGVVGLMGSGGGPSSTDPIRSSSSSSSSSPPTGEDGPATAATTTRLRRLKDRMWLREAREDLTAAEFACSVESALGSEASTTTVSSSSTRRKRKRAVDYEKLLSQLNLRVRDMGCAAPPPPTDNNSNGATEPSAVVVTDVSCVLQSGVGMGSIACTDAQREALLERILRTRQMLLEVMKGHELYPEDELPFSLLTLPELRVELPKDAPGVGEESVGPKLYVRDDGTVDWDGALQDREALRKFGTAVWARINGRDPESLAEEATADVVPPPTPEPKIVTAKVEETPEIRTARMELDELRQTLDRMEKEHVALLNSAMSAGQAVANVNLATLQPSQRIRILESADALEQMKEQVSFQTMLYELERIYSYLVKEVGNPALAGYIPLQDRLNVAEFGLLESQIESFNRQLAKGELVDADVLAVVMDQLVDFKRRLGIDYSVTGVTFDGDGIRRWLAELSDKTKKGLAFYVKGVQLFWNDIIFCLTLINRAAQGYTLKPREVRTLRYDA